MSHNGTATEPTVPLVFLPEETVDYIVDRCAATGEAYLPEQVEAVMECQLEYLRFIGAIGRPATDEGDADPARHASHGIRRKVAPGTPPLVVRISVPGKGGGPYMHDQHGTLEVRGR